MIEINLPNIITIMIAGMLGYALLIGLAKATQQFRGGAGVAA